MDYKQLQKKLKEMQKTGYNIGTYGKSILGRDLFYISVGEGDFCIIIQGAIHAREHITTDLILKLCENVKSKSFYGAKIYFLPMTNPDGVEICCNGESSVKDKELKSAVSQQLEIIDKGLFKANARLVDLNVNFPSMYGKGSQNLTFPHFENYIGTGPLSESESKALADFTLSVKPSGTISYHSKGEEIYFSFMNQKNFHRDFLIAKEISENTGYPLVSLQKSTGGYKDWCISHLGISALTIEVGEDSLSHPIVAEHLEKIYEKNKDVPLRYIKSILKHE